MKKVLLAVAVTMSVFCATGSYALTPYVAGGGGYNFVSDSDMNADLTDGDVASVSFDSGYAFRGAVGARIGQNFRLEIEGFYSENDMDDVNLMNIVSVDASKEASTTGVLLNGYFDLNLGGPFVPYASAGLGYANAEFGKLEDDVFAYTFGAGIAYEFNKNVALDFGYRYLATEDIDDKSGLVGFSVGYESQQLLLGVRYTF
jgi:opacity protein-like surface antigen